MTERVGLGHPDADGRWLGLARHQAGLAITGAFLGVEGIVHRSGWWLAVGMAAAALATPLGGRSLGARASDVARFAARRRVVHVSVVRLAPDALVTATGAATCAPFVLRHHGRLDLTGADGVVTGAVVDALREASEDPRSRHVSVHTEPGVGTLLAARAGSDVPPGWDRDVDALEAACGVGPGRDGVWLERWGYLRGTSGVARVWRVDDLTAAAPWSVARLARPGVTVSLHAEALDPARAVRRAERLVHALRTEDAADDRAGRRWRARRRRDLERSREREADLAAGATLVRLGVFVVARATDLADLARRGAQVEARARRLGLGLDRGRGRQGPWLVAQLPGGPGW